MSAEILYDDVAPPAAQRDAIQAIKERAARAGLELLRLINARGRWDAEGYTGLQVATSESLTCGLIMATLVDIPWGGFMKYGGFGVYDTDAKRVFNSVGVDDVYTHKCASEMAVGVLRNSNATLAIAVTGNAMPLNAHVSMLGEVFIGIAGYNADGQIIFLTRSMNACMETDHPAMRKTCRRWFRTIADRGQYNPRSETAAVSHEIRHYTVLKAFELCAEFVERFDPSVPTEVLERKRLNEHLDERLVHHKVPPARYAFGGEGLCVNSDRTCPARGLRSEEQVSLYTAERSEKGKQRRAQ
jgi:nicotinamide mononucleotide (NMN) deamidase PncC